MSRFSKLLLYVVYFAVLAVLVGVILHSFKNDTKTIPKPATQQQATHQSSPKAVKPAPSTKPTTTTTPTTSPTTTTVTAPNTSALVNTGPGNMLAVFAVASLAGVIGYRRHLLRRLN